MNSFKELIGIKSKEKETEEKLKQEVEQLEDLQKKQAARSAGNKNTEAVEKKGPTSTLPGKRFTEQVKLVVIKPISFEDSTPLVESLKARKPIIINLEDTETEVARKIFDFLSGATYALNGNAQKIANNIFLFAPENVVVDNNGSMHIDGSESSRWE